MARPRGTVKTKTRARPLTPREVKAGEPDPRPWHDRALDSKFLKLEPGGHTLLVVGEPVERVSDFDAARLVVDIPTRGGVWSTGAFAVLRPLAEYLKKHGRCTGATIRLTATGEEANRRYESVTVK